MRRIVDERKFLSDPDFNAVIEKINQGENELKVSGLHGSARSFLFTVLFKSIKKPQIIICSTEREARNVHRDVSFFLDGGNAIFYPPWEIVSTDMLSYQRDVESRRIETLFRLVSGSPAVFVIPLSALLQRAVPRNILENYVETISIGDTLERDSFTAKLDEGGYRRVSLVEGEGEFSVRGHVIDIFPPISAMPLRMLFIGDELESIREFDTVSQRSAKEIDEFVLTPARELILSGDIQRQAVRNLKKRAGELGISGTMRNRIAEMIKNDLSSSINPLFLPLFYNGLDTIFNYVPEDSVVIFDDFISMEHAEEKIVNDIDRFLLRAEREDKFYLGREMFHVSMADLFQRFKDLQRIYVDGFEIGIDGENDSAVKFHVETNTGLKKEASELSMEDGILSPLVEKIREWMDGGNLVSFLCSGEEGIQRMSNLLMGYSLPVTRSYVPILSELARHDGKGRLILKDGKITEGFHFPGPKLVVVSEEEVFGKKKKRRKARPVREGYFLKSFGELKEGDFIVHTDHGIGKYLGLKKLSVGKIENDFLLIE
ncbi:MAG: CarD family transcriptional regulator, partial [Thermodesulfobacteriota bacterium]|nr:CarD family transcriptional regulator [Thermodesulfobacteriota bacterium]